MDPFVPSDAEALVTLGVDTHADVHVCVALDRLGRRLGNKSVPTKQAGYAELVGWAEEFGALETASASRAAPASAWGSRVSCGPGEWELLR